MKKILIACFAILAMAGCKPDKPSMDAALLQRTDSLETALTQRDNQINDMMGTLNEIQEGFRQINEAENRVNVAKDGESSNKARNIKENIQFIAERMKENKELIEKLKKQLERSAFKGDQLKKAIENLVRQLEEKDQQLQQLRAELDAKNIHISELDATINNLNTNVSSLKDQNSKQSQTISSQDAQLNTAWYVFGTKKELKEQNILVGGKVLQSNFNKNYFTKIDIRNDREIKLYSRSAKLLTMHPSSSYTLAQDGNKQYVLTITNPQLFWSTSKYLVVLVK